MLTKVRPVIILAVALASPAAAQFSDLASSPDGSRLYFSSAARLRGSDNLFIAKIFRIDAQGPALVRSQDPGPSIGWTTQNFGMLVAPQAAPGGSLAGFTGTRNCYGGSGCLAVERAQGVVLDAAGNTLLTRPGYLNLSPNGRYALFFNRNTFVGLISAAELDDVTGGTSQPLKYAIPAQARRRVANDGTVAVVVQGSVRLWTTSGEITLPGITVPADAEKFLFLSADGRRVVVQTAAGLSLYDRDAASLRTLFPGMPASASASEDARTVAYVDPADGQAYLATGSSARRLTQEVDRMTEVALSGDGSTVFAATDTGRILRIDAASAAVAEWVPRTPWIVSSTLSPSYSAIEAAEAPGSLVPLRGTGLADQTQHAAAPLPRTLGGVQVRIGGVDAALSYVSPGLIWLQVPWETPLGDHVRLEYLSGSSPFETQPGELQVTAAAPYPFESLEGYNVFLTAVHQDGRTLVTPESPAVAGELVSYYFTGLGPVSPAARTGEAAPSAPPPQITMPLRCQFWDGGPNDTRLVFAGLAPAEIGIYQVVLQIPPLKLPAPELACDFGPGTPSAFGTTYVTATPPLPPPRGGRRGRVWNQK
jgi:uncharacterized protein (TIGR03437 family)